jgi:hypothetical protein
MDMRGFRILIAASLTSGCIAGEATDLAISAGAPVTAAVDGTITRCGIPVSDAAVVLRVRQDDVGQARPVDTQIGPVTTDGGGRYLVTISPSFAIPGPATVELQVTPPGGAVQGLTGATVQMALGEPPRDTLHLSADVGLATRACP